MNILSSVLLLFLPAAAQPLPPWQPGILDIHQIHTGRGNAAFAILPDGTTLLIDAGAVPDRTGLEIGPARPNASQPPAEWIARYIRQYSPRPDAPLDYAVITHYHDDHMGAIPQLATLLPIRRLIDRGLEPAPPPYPVVRAYLTFRQSFAGEIQPLRPGRADQIVLRHNPAAVSGFEIRNVAANGIVWTGQGNSATLRFPANWRQLPAPEQPGENDFSLALRIRYGPFTWFTGGDLAGVLLDDLPTWRDLETPVAQAIGPVDALVLNHHGWLDSTNPVFLHTLNPRVVIIPAWHATHPDHAVLRRLRSPRWKPTPPDLFITSLLDVPRTLFRYLGESFRSTDGHVVIRVQPGGASYQVLILDHQSETPVVKATFGPYAARSAARP
jgi:hypothetical protein